ncbi:hypothetical protein HYX04_03375 [Candidatus Woesearchaeota archaeon]|nr:hypothetical protein [Candidatus Woesearchaeota archaeon]
MAQSTYIGRRDFLRYAALGASLAVPIALRNIGALSPLEATAAEAGKEYQTAKTQDIPSEIATIILQNINKLNKFYKNNETMSPLVYYDISADYDLAVNAAHNRSKASNLEKLKEYSGLEVVARMWHADLLLNKVRVNIVTDGAIEINGLPKIVAKRKLGDAYIGDNLFKALENYERVAGILQKSEDKMPNQVGVGILGDYGRVATPYLVYYRMSQTISQLLQNADKRYHPALQKKKRAVDQQLERLKRASVKVLG